MGLKTSLFWSEPSRILFLLREEVVIQRTPCDESHNWDYVLSKFIALFSAWNGNEAFIKEICLNDNLDCEVFGDQKHEDVVCVAELDCQQKPYKPRKTVVSLNHSTGERSPRKTIDRQTAVRLNEWCYILPGCPRNTSGVFVL